MLKFSQLFVAVGIAAASGLTFGFVSSKADPQSRYQATLQRVDTRFSGEQTRCQALPQQKVRLCLALALTEKWTAIAQAQVKLNDTPEARRNQRVVAAGGELLIALQRCSASAHADRLACRDSAKEAFLRELAQVRGQEAREQPCYPAECAWTSQPPHDAVITSI
jgi:hypothetical protein